jgi:hypothetical protein
MRSCLKLGACLGALALFSIGAAAPAHAYIDPGSANFIIQMILGAFLGAALAIATFWRRVKAFFGRIFGRKPEEADEDRTVVEAKDPSSGSR